MGHIHTEPGQHDHTVSIYLFRTDFKEPKIMLHLHRKVGMYAQFGGHIELDETPWQAVIHELAEETGYDIRQLQILQPKERVQKNTWATVHPLPAVYATMKYPRSNNHFHTDSAYAFIADSKPQNAPHEGESTDIKLFSRNELESIGQEQVNIVTLDTTLHLFDMILSNWKPVSPNEFK